MNGFMTAGRPATAFLQTHRVIGAADQNLAALDLLEMALQAECRIARGQQFGVDAAMRRVTSGAAFVHRLVFEHIWSALGLMTLNAILLLREHLCAAARVGNPLVRRMTEDACHPAFGHGMMAGQFELAAHIHVTGVANRFFSARW